jgi:cytochrome c biogenesis protein CcdA
VLALGEHAGRRVAAFTAGVWAVSTVGGLVLLFTLGRTLLVRVAHPSAHTRAVIELAIGLVLLAAALVLWLLRHRIRARVGHAPKSGGRSALYLGAGIMAVELPTAFPYFAAILATLGAAHGAILQTLVILLYNVVFVVPLLAILVIAAVTGSRYLGRLRRLSEALERHMPVLLPIGIACIGAALTVVGALGL